MRYAPFEMTHSTLELSVGKLVLWSGSKVYLMPKQICHLDRAKPSERPVFLASNVSRQSHSLADNILRLRSDCFQMECLRKHVHQLDRLQEYPDCNSVCKSLASVAGSHET